MAGSAIAGWCGESMFGFGRNCHTVSPGGRAILRPQQRERAPAAPQWCQHLVSKLIWIWAILIGYSDHLVLCAFP